MIKILLFNFLNGRKRDNNPQKRSKLLNKPSTLRKTKKTSHFCEVFFFVCSPSWARTKDPLINSQML